MGEGERRKERDADRQRGGCTRDKEIGDKNISKDRTRNRFEKGANRKVETKTPIATEQKKPKKEKKNKNKSAK